MTAEMNDNLIDNLTQDSRVLKTARMLPMDGTLTEEQVTGVRLDFLRYTNANGIFDARVARETGISPAVLSQFKAGKYPGDCDKVARTLNDWMEFHSRKVRAALPCDFIETKIAEEIFGVVNAACVGGSMAAIVTPSGSGKSTCIQFLCEKYRGHLIYCTQDLTPRSFLAKIASVIGVSTRSRTKAEFMERIVEKLNGTNRPVFLDEAHQLPVECLSRIRAIFDLTGSPFLMFGTAAILDRINDRTDGRGQFASRCLQYNCLEHVLNAEAPGGGGATGNKLGRPLFTKAEVERFLNNLQVRFEPEALDLAWALACLPNHGCLRTVRRVVLLLRPEAATRQKPMTQREIYKALTMLFGQLGAAIGKWAERHIEITANAA